jgi:tetrahydromethanopterin S-methyltransferase subunit F
VKFVQTLSDIMNLKHLMNIECQNVIHVSERWKVNSEVTMKQGVLYRRKYITTQRLDSGLNYSSGLINGMVVTVDSHSR